MRPTRLARTLAVVALVIATVGVEAPSASARPASGTNLTCGAVLTTDTVLGNDLTCAGTAITVDGDVRLDLGGHRILGPGSTSGASGIVLSGNAHDVTLVNGRIDGWGVGVRGRDDGESQHIVIDNVDFDGNGSAVPSPIASTIEVSRSHFTGNGFGIGGLSPASVSVQDSTFTGNGTATAMYVSGRLTITRTTLADNDKAVDSSEGWVEITRSTLRGNGTGVYNRWGTANISRSTLTGNEQGVFLEFGSYGTIASNTFDSNTAGIRASWGDNSTVRGNTFTRNGTGFLSLPIPDGMNETATLLDGNSFSRNTDGIYSTQVGVKLANNVATNNTGWGIYTEDAVDLGGNRARNNGSSPQCTGVVC